MMIKSRPAVTEEEKAADAAAKAKMDFGRAVGDVMQAAFSARTHKRLFEEGKTSMDHEKIWKDYEDLYQKLLSEAADDVKVEVSKRLAAIEAEDKAETDMDDEAKALIAKGNRLWQKGGKARIYVTGKYSYYDVIEHRYVK